MFHTLRGRWRGPKRETVLRGGRNGVRTGFSGGAALSELSFQRGFMWRDGFQMKLPGGAGGALLICGSGCLLLGERCHGRRGVPFAASSDACCSLLTAGGGGGARLYRNVSLSLYPRLSALSPETIFHFSGFCRS